MKRKALSKKGREQVFNKCGGRCAYCGCELEYKDMQVDHIESVYAHNGDNSIDNFMPACRMCNFYKSTFSIEEFRNRLQTVTLRLDNLFLYKLAVRYKIIEVNNRPIQFYFEKLKKVKEDE